MVSRLGAKVTGFIGPTAQTVPQQAQQSIRSPGVYFGSQGSGLLGMLGFSFRASDLVRASGPVNSKP